MTEDKFNATSSKNKSANERRDIVGSQRRRVAQTATLIGTAPPVYRSPVQILAFVIAFNFANKINASRGFECGKSSGEGKSPTRRAFEAVDVNGDRRIDREELQVAVQRMGCNALDDGVIDEFFEFQSGGNANYIDCINFSNAIERVPSNICASCSRKRAKLMLCILFACIVKLEN